MSNKARDWRFSNSFRLFLRYFHTIRHLKFIQIRYQIFYILRRKLGWTAQLAPIPLSKIPSSQSLQFQASIPSYTTYLGHHHFSFLNISHSFDAEIDWNYAAYGKLWTYNLNYFEFLSQANLESKTGLYLIQDFIKKEPSLKDGLEPFPTSLRTIFWIKFLSKHRIQDAEINRFLFLQLKLLTRQLEYHLLGNHLLENGFALLFGSYYFSNQSFFKMAQKILTTELKEQILADGAHFEQSPMYHQLMLFRLLDSINLIQNNPNHFSNDGLAFFQKKAKLMLGWLQAMTFADGTIPHFNDSTNNIAPLPQDLQAYGARLNLSPKKIQLKDCGYRKYKSTNYEIIVDIGNIAADYIPGHAHSDVLHFVLHYDGYPLLVDTGISTYEKNNLRTKERSTTAHNTVKIGEMEQSDVWGGFRVGRRAKIVHISEKSRIIQASHNGYAHQEIYHERMFEFGRHTITIVDKLDSAHHAKAYFHFHPSIKVELRTHTLFGNFGAILFENAHQISLEQYDYAMGFNQTQKAYVAVVHFAQHLQTKIQLR